MTNVTFAILVDLRTMGLLAGGRRRQSLDSSQEQLRLLQHRKGFPHAVVVLQVRTSSERETTKNNKFCSALW